MDQINHTGLISGFNNLKQLEMAVAAAQKMTGSATMSMDPEAIQNAEKALQDAKAIYQTAGDTGVDQDRMNFFCNASTSLTRQNNSMNIKIR
jgi:hypothetical protein